jgi:hypothetical protein
MPRIATTLAACCVHAKWSAQASVAVSRGLSGENAVQYDEARVRRGEVTRTRFESMPIKGERQRAFLVPFEYTYGSSECPMIGRAEDGQIPKLIDGRSHLMLSMSL